MAILQLQEKGKLRLDDPAWKHIPEWKNIKFVGTNNKTVKIIDLLTHNSGLASDLNSEFFLDPNMDSKGILLRFQSLSQRLGETSRGDQNRINSYSNLAFSLLGNIVERRSGKNIEDYFQREIFQKADMKNSTLLETYNSNKTMIGYSGLVFLSEEENPVIRDLSAGSMSTTPEDMANFISCLMESKDKNGKLISQKSYNELIQRKVLPFENFEMDWGVTLFRYNRYLDGKPYTLVGHTGSLPPFIANLVWDPISKTGIFIATNTAHPSAGKMEKISEEIIAKLITQSPLPYLRCPIWMIGPCRRKSSTNYLKQPSL